MQFSALTWITSKIDFIMRIKPATKQAGTTATHFQPSDTRPPNSKYAIFEKSGFGGGLRFRQQTKRTMISTYPKCAVEAICHEYISTEATAFRTLSFSQYQSTRQERLNASSDLVPMISESDDSMFAPQSSFIIFLSSIKTTAR